MEHVLAITIHDIANRCRITCPSRATKEKKHARYVGAAVRTADMPVFHTVGAHHKETIQTSGHSSYNASIRTGMRTHGSFKCPKVCNNSMSIQTQQRMTNEQKTDMAINVSLESSYSVRL